MPKETLAAQNTSEMLQRILEQLSVIAANLNQKASGDATSDVMISRDVADMLKVSIDEACKLGPNLGRKVGREWRYLRSEVERYLRPKIQTVADQTRRRRIPLDPAVRC